MSTHDAVLHVLSILRPDLKLQFESSSELKECEEFNIKILRESNLEARTDQDEYFAYSF